MPGQPFMKLIEKGLCLFLTYSLSFVGADFSDFSLNHAELLNVIQRLCCNLTLAIGV